MAFPTVAATNTTTAGSATDPATFNLPASITAGDLLLLYVDTYAVPAITINTPAGWTQLLNDVETTNTRIRVALFYKVADGGEGSTVDVDFSGAAHGSGFAYRIDTGSYNGSPEGAITTGNDANPNPPEVTPTWGALDTLWIIGASGFGTFSATPANYGNDLNVDPGVDRARSARRELNAASENPGTFTNGESNGWVALTVAVRPAGAAATGHNLTLIGVGT